jgi:6-pyruvoyltetrahydropterin/6-carboxytetrahydropterin synthase
MNRVPADSIDISSARHLSYTALLQERILSLFLQERNPMPGSGGYMPEPYEIHVSSTFAASHCLKDHPGPCARVHGHNWKVEVAVSCTSLDEQDMGIDFLVLKNGLDEVLSVLDHTHLNDLEDLDGVNPTAESLARYIHQRLNEKLASDRVRVSAVKLWETPDFGVLYRG